MNSWQQPVSGEPSLGTPHKHVATILNTDPSSTGVQTLDISANVPVGTTWVEGYWYILSATANRTGRLCNSGDTETYLYIHNPVAGQTGRGQFSCPVVDRKIYWAVNNTDVSSFGMQMNRYWC